VVAIEDDLAAIAEEIRGAEEQLAELRAIRSYIVEAAVDERMSHRQIAELLGITHTAVQKILQEAGWRRDILGRINAGS
jgi:DNA-directed RNA polymerase specialized sigma24 family protein